MYITCITHVANRSTNQILTFVLQYSRDTYDHHHFYVYMRLYYVCVLYT